MAPKLADILITSELHRRRPAHIDRAHVNRSLRDLSPHVANHDSEGLLKQLTEVALDLCQAGTGGLSALEIQRDGSTQFRWVAMSGALAGFVDGTTPRDFSPCGCTLDKRSAQLFFYPHRYFTYFAQAEPLIVEGLVLPLWLEGNVPYGTLWVASHDEKRKFTQSDVEVMGSLCSFTMAAARILGIKPRDLSGGRSAQISA